MTEHLGGPGARTSCTSVRPATTASRAAIACSKIVDVASGAGAGSVGFWTKQWRDEQMYEIGWMVVPEFQGRGIAWAAIAQAIDLAKRDDKHHFMHAFPHVDNASTCAPS